MRLLPLLAVFSLGCAGCYPASAYLSHEDDRQLEYDYCVKHRHIVLTVFPEHNIQLKACKTYMQRICEEMGQPGCPDAIPIVDNL